MKQTEETIWTGRTLVKPNLWGLNNEGGRLRISGLTGIGTSRDDQFGPLAIILWSMIILPLSSLIVSAISITLMILWITVYMSSLLYWLIIREIKYYRMTKSTVYKVTSSNIVMDYKTFTGSQKITIPINDIKKIHLVKYLEDGIETGSIHLYLDYKIKTYSLGRKERTNQFVIERVLDFENGTNVINEQRGVYS